MNSPALIPGEFNGCGGFGIRTKRRVADLPSNEERVLAAAIYLITFFTVFIGPLIIWLLKKDESSFIDFHGREYFNFLISTVVYGIIAFMLTFVGIGFILLPLVSLYFLVFVIVGAVKAYSGEYYRIPFIFRLFL